MTDLSRFRVIAGGMDKLKVCRRSTAISRNGLAEIWEHYKCGECSDELGFPFSQLHEVRTGAIVTSARGSAGKVISGQTWLACPRCHQLRFQLRADDHLHDEV